MLIHRLRNNVVNKEQFLMQMTQKSKHKNARSTKWLEILVTEDFNNNNNNNKNINKSFTYYAWTKETFVW